MSETENLKDKVRFDDPIICKPTWHTLMVRPTQQRLLWLLQTTIDSVD